MFETYVKNRDTKNVEKQLQEIKEEKTKAFAIKH
jgi:hypothetical protein